MPKIDHAVTMPLDLLDANAFWKEVDLLFLRNFFGVNFSWLIEQDNPDHPNGRMLLAIDAAPNQRVGALELTSSEIFDALKRLGVPKLSWLSDMREDFGQALAEKKQ